MHPIQKFHKLPAYLRDASNKITKVIKLSATSYNSIQFLLSMMSLNMFQKLLSIHKSRHFEKSSFVINL